MIEFGTGGFRSIIGDGFTKENVQKVCSALAIYITRNNFKKEVAIGYDLRFASEYACKWATESLASNGIDVLLTDGPVSTPITMSVVDVKSLDFGVMITASHNPYMYNGVKIFEKNGKDISISTSNEILEIINENKKIENVSFNNLLNASKIKYIDFKTIYLENVEKFLTPLRSNNINVLIDSLHGTGMVAIPEICEYLGVNNYVMINNSHDAYFGGMSPNPLEKNMQKDRELLMESNFDICFGFDSDADRLGVLDEKGRYVDANELFGVVYYYLSIYKNIRGDVVRNIQTSHLIDALAEKTAFRCYETDVGANNVSDEMKKRNAILGGESSGGIMINGYIEGKDACLQAALLLEMIGELQKPLSSIIDEMYEYSDFKLVHKEISIEYDYEYKETILNQIPMIKSLFKDLRSIEQLNNNIKFLFENGVWCILRFSGTEPVIRIFVEDISYQNIENKFEIIRNFIGKVKN